MNQSITQSFSISFTYKVHFDKDIFDVDNGLMAGLFQSKFKPKVLFVIDEGVYTAHPSLVKKITDYSNHHQTYTLAGSPLVLPGGEQAKNDSSILQQVLDKINEYDIDRHSYVVAIGGGAILDMAGMASTIAHRGVRHIRIPTTVLAQNDSGVGVKNGVNAYGKKNYLGAFAPPYAVINDFTFLPTLDDRDWRGGISEAVKVALIKDKDFFVWIKENAKKLAARDMEAMEYLIYRCAEMHLDHISGGDPFELGSSRPLDFGHWAAHKLEQLTNYELRHGEAVAIGIALDTTYSYLQNRISKEDLIQVIELFFDLGFDIYIEEVADPQVIKGLEEFQQHLGGILTIMLLESVGKGVEVHEMDAELIRKTVTQLKAFQESSRPIAL